ncbi:unnamed protein product [Lactuca saligna]|uniref:non-specific serine/threonine protein kinase n=1 Tax=Lactuca saligna TaxID=75948 RepID=A0AA35YSQ4_LACSI|nr:unnamed protein product [Lactuca saligna]
MLKENPVQELQLQNPNPNQNPPKILTTMAANSPTTTRKEGEFLLLGRYEIGKLLGHGTFSKVYLGRNVKTNEFVAIKVIDKEQILKGGLISHIKREISILRRVRHPNIVQLFEGFVMLVVSDFGLSAISEQIRGDGLFHTFCGTPAYVAPEVLGRKGYEAAKVDIWSCGVILFVLMAGYLPFHDQNVMVMYKKIYRGEFRCPRWFSPELSRLLKRLLQTNPVTRITIPELMENRWFKKGFKNIKFYLEDDKLFSVKDEDFKDDDIDYSSDQSSRPESPTEVDTRKRLTTMPRPASLNAFDLISFSPGFSLSGLFEDAGEELRFVSGATVPHIISKLEEIAKGVSFKVRKKDFRVSLEGSREGVKGPLTIGAEIFELTPNLRMIEVKKNAGDKGEYDEFFDRELRPGLRTLMLPAPISGESSVLPSETESLK